MLYLTKRIMNKLETVVSTRKIKPMTTETVSNLNLHGYLLPRF